MHYAQGDGCINPPYDPAQPLQEATLRFRASVGWLTRFLDRHNLVLRRRTNNHKLTREERVPYVIRYAHAGVCAMLTSGAVTQRRAVCRAQSGVEDAPDPEERPRGRSLRRRPRWSLPRAHVLQHGSGPLAGRRQRRCASCAEMGLNDKCGAGTDGRCGVCAPGRTYDTRGASDIQVKQANPSNNGTPRFGTIHIVVHGGSGAQCPLYLIYAGKNDPPAAETQQYAPGIQYCMQAKAWMDKPTLLKWFSQVWLPYRKAWHLKTPEHGAHAGGFAAELMQAVEGGCAVLPRS
jgi:hypothetical protein